MPELTPAMKQYFDVKKQYPDCIIFFRMGDFYETFGDDAKITSRELDIVLTSRSHGGDGERMPLAGVPYHAIESYLARLVKKGYKVAICEQVEDPKLAKGIVKREVVRVVTPGTVLEPNMLNEKANNYLAAVARDEASGGYGIAFADLSTGEFFCTQVEDVGKLLSELARFKPAECILPPLVAGNETLLNELKRCCESCMAHSYDENKFEKDSAYQVLVKHFKTASLDGFGIENQPLATGAAGALLSYLKETQKNTLDYVSSIRTYSITDFMILDPTTLRNLEVVRNIRDGSAKGTLLEVLDSTSSAMGSRLLKKWLLQPLIGVSEINGRLDAVSELFGNAVLRSDMREFASRLNDMERLIGRVTYGLANGRDLVALKESLKLVPRVKSLLAGKPASSALLGRLETELDPLPEVVALIEKAIVDEPPVSVREGGMIKDGYRAELDSFREAMKGGRDWMAELEKNERKRTGIKSLKVGYNQVFGYYIEVSRPNLASVPQDYIRKQTLATGERFITPGLKEKEELVLTASEKSIALEYEIFNEVRQTVAEKAARIQLTANALAVLDVLSAFAEVSVSNGYSRPEVGEQNSILVREGRHPVVEKYLPGGFVPNDSLLDCTENQLIILTGPNMAGKSTYMRQVALITLMTQLGCFVPAKYASIGVVDRIFTRVGAFDDLTSGQSTFMVEMTELANILNNATPKSLILLDEIGRGTSTFDGLSIACAVVEYIHTHSKLNTKTMFATHYHQLTQLSVSLRKLKNYHIAVKEEKDTVVFLRKVVPGATDRSYGIHVARLAGVPKKIVDRAKQFLAQLEKEELTLDGKTGEAVKRMPRYTQVVLFDSPDHPAQHPVVSELQKLDISTMTPVDALMKLNELQKKSSQKVTLDKDGLERDDMNRDRDEENKKEGI